MSAAWLPYVGAVLTVIGGFVARDIRRSVKARKEGELAGAVQTAQEFLTTQLATLTEHTRDEHKETRAQVRASFDKLESRLTVHEDKDDTRFATQAALTASYESAFRDVARTFAENTAASREQAAQLARVLATTAHELADDTRATARGLVDEGKATAQGLADAGKATAKTSDDRLTELEARMGKQERRRK